MFLSIFPQKCHSQMVLRRPHHTGSIARDSYISDIGGVIDSVFTPPLVPPPPYSPPEYTEISNDPIIIEGPDFLDDLSTPTPVLPIAPHEMPPPYSTLDLLPGTTIECSVAQEFQMANEEVGNHFHFLSLNFLFKMVVVSFKRLYQWYFKYHLTLMQKKLPNQ